MTSTTRQDGSAMVMAVGFMLVVFAISAVAVDGARLWLLRRGLQHTADAASVAAAAQLDQRAFYRSGGTTAALDRSAAMGAAREMLARRGIAAAFDIIVEKDLVRAVVSAKLRTSLLSLVGVDELRVSAEGAAEPVLGDAP